MSVKKRKPDFVLKLWHEQTSSYTKAGVAWIEEDGSLSLTISPGVSVQWDDGLSKKLFKADERNS